MPAYCPGQLRHVCGTGGLCPFSLSALVLPAVCPGTIVALSRSPFFYSPSFASSRGLPFVFGDINISGGLVGCACTYKRFACVLMIFQSACALLFDEAHEGIYI